MENSEVMEPTENKTRGWLLTAFLILMLIANPFTAYSYFSNPEAIIQVYPAISHGLLNFMGLLAIINIVLAVAIWSWKKVGVYGFYLSMVVAFCINMYVGIPLAGSLMGLIGAVIIFFTTKSRWDNFS